MKRAIKYFVVILITGMIAGCAKQLELQPYQYIDVSQALNTANDVQVALVGSYHDLGLSGLLGGRNFLQADLLGDAGDIKWRGTYEELTQIKDKAIPITNAFVSDLWTEGYAAINDVNNILAALDKVDTADRKRVEGEAKFIRAVSYFEMIRLFGKDYGDGDPSSNLGIPIVLTPTVGVNDSSYVKRNTVKEVYNQILSDLNTAKAYLPEENSFYATTYAASAILSRVYLQQEDYANALTEADRVIESEFYELNDSYADEFLGGYDPNNPGHVDNSAEDIFAIQVNATSGTNGLNEFYASGDFGGRGDALITAQHLDNYEAGDDRLNMYADSYTQKFNNYYGNVHLIRLAEMYLNRAEANFRLSSSVGDDPINDINLIRERVLLPDLSALTLDDILHERYVELAFENGFFLHDKKRLKQDVGSLPYNDPTLVFPIPQRELVANKNLVQNEGYH